MPTTVTDRPSIDLRRLRSLAAMLASEHDGEVVNAARALVRAAASAGLKVQELIGTPVSGAPQARAWQQAHAPASPYMENLKAFQDAFRRDYGGGGKTAQDWRKILRQVQLKTVGTKLLSDAQSALVFQVLPDHVASGREPHSLFLYEFFCIAARLGIA
jgi:hypothetical protein